MCFLNTIPQAKEVVRDNAKFGEQITKSVSQKGLGKYIYKLSFGGNKPCNQVSKCNFFSNKMIIYLNMFSAGIKDRINNHMESTNVVT